MKQPKLHLKYRSHPIIKFYLNGEFDHEDKTVDKDVDVLCVHWDKGNITYVETETAIYFKIDDGLFVLDIYEDTPRVVGELIWESPKIFDQGQVKGK